jgi:hypothetical protein
VFFVYRSPDAVELLSKAVLMFSDFTYGQHARIHHTSMNTNTLTSIIDTQHIHTHEHQDINTQKHQHTKHYINTAHWSQAMHQHINANVRHINTLTNQHQHITHQHTNTPKKQRIDINTSYWYRTSNTNAAKQHVNALTHMTFHNAPTHYINTSAHQQLPQTSAFDKKRAHKSRFGPNNCCLTRICRLQSTVSSLKRH